MNREIKEVISIPQGIEIETKDKEVIIKKGNNKIAKKYTGFEVKKEGDKLELYNKECTKKEKKLIKSLAAHIRSIIKGLEEKYTYQLRVCFVHFPTSIELKNNELLVKNFLGEKTPRKAKILPDVEAKIEKDLITLSSWDKEKVGQTAANIEQATKIRNRDRRIFQDGIFMIKKSKGRAS